MILNKEQVKEKILELLSNRDFCLDEDYEEGCVICDSIKKINEEVKKW